MVQVLHGFDISQKPNACDEQVAPLTIADAGEE